MSSEATGNDNGSGANETNLKQQSGLRRPLQSTQEKLQNGLGIIVISNLLCLLHMLLLA
jgi:hypothetical protein